VDGQFQNRIGHRSIKMKLAGVTIRLASADDGEGMATLFMRVWHLSLREIVPAGFLEQFEHEKQKQKYSERAVDSNWLLSVAVFQGQIIGMIAAKDNDWEPRLYQKQIKAMYVDPEFQSRGVGQALLASIFADLKRQGITKVALWCIEANKRARSFYERHGGTKLEGVEPPQEYAAMPHVVYGWDCA
jgi:GNAT superfamily N-acetyltransferase